MAVDTDELQRQIEEVRLIAEDAHDKFPLRSTTRAGASRERHIHDLSKHPGAVAVGSVGFDDATSDPVNADSTAAADGVENSVARKDHRHLATNSSTTNKGIVELATTNEVSTGTDTFRVVPVAGLPIQIQGSKYLFAADTASDDDYLISLTPAVAAYAAGQVFHFTAQTVNTGAATLNVNGLGAKAILKEHDVALANGDIEAGQIVTVVYDGTQFQMQSLLGNAPGGGGDVSAAANMTDNTIIKGDGGVKGVQDSGIVIDDSENVSGMGTLACGEITVADGSSINLQEALTFTGATTENLIEMPDNLADALSIKEGSNTYLKFVTTNDGEALDIAQRVTFADVTHNASSQYTLIDMGMRVTAASANDVGLAGIFAANIELSVATNTTGHSVRGLNFTAIVRGGGGTSTVTDVTALRIRAGTTSYTGTIADGYGIFIDNFIASFGTPVITLYTSLHIDARGSNKIVDAYGIRIRDMTQPTGFNRLLEIGSPTPTTTSGLFRMIGNFTAATNETPIFISEGSTPTLRQLKTFDPGSGGANFAGGELVCILV